MFLLLLVSTHLIGGLEGSTLIAVPPESRNATVGETVTFICISQFASSLTLSADSTMIMTKTNDNNNLQKTLNITVPSGISEINVTCTATRGQKNESRSAKLMIQGLLSGVGNLTSSEVNHCTALYFTWTAPYTLQGVPIIYYTINITRHSDGAMLMSDRTNTTEYLYTVSNLGETLEVVVAAVNGAGTGNVSSIATQTLSIKVVKNGAERRSKTNWSYTFAIDEHGMSTCGNAISNATVKACLDLNPSSCVTSSGTFNTLRDGRRVIKISFDKLIENRHYSHSTMDLFVSGTMAMSQQVTISTFDVQKTALHGPINDGQVCLDIDFAVGSTSTNCFSKFKSSDTGDTVYNVTMNGTLSCVANVPPISVDILFTDPDAIDEIDTNPAYTLEVVVPHYTRQNMLMSSTESIAVTSNMMAESTSSIISISSPSITTTSLVPSTGIEAGHIAIIAVIAIGVFIVVAVIVGLCIILSFKKTNKSKFQVLGMEGFQLSDQPSRERLSSQNSSTASATSERSNSLSVTSPTSPWPTSPISDEAFRIGTPTTTSSSSTTSATVIDRTEGTTSRHNSDSTSQSQARTSPTTTHEEIATGGQIRGVGESDQQTLTISDLRDVLHQLSNLTPSNYNMLGLELGLLAPTLKQLKSTHSSEDFGLHVMEAWLNQVDEVNPTWECLIAALQSPIVKQNAIARQLRQWLTSR